MKKTIFAFIFAIMFGMAIGSCGNGTGTATKGVDSVVIDNRVRKKLNNVEYRTELRCSSVIFVFKNYSNII